MTTKKKKTSRRLSRKRTPSRVREGDCLELLSRVSSDSVPLAFADPPFNIGYSYDTYHDRRSTDDYLDWSTPKLGCLVLHVWRELSAEVQSFTRPLISLRL